MFLSDLSDLSLTCLGPLSSPTTSPAAARWEGTSLGVGLIEPKSYIYLRSGLFAGYQMGLYLNKNQFLAAPPLLPGSAGVPGSLQGKGGRAFTRVPDLPGHCSS